ncbi:TM0106 family RecB-like putative nuclease [Sphingomicrobium sp. XHP0239]|uniref:TM0106 family RecB-like putative nuclease n=1 Tax=Sphingomicrobium maritimum TaxID=3133972 RepID=UPI0031CCD80C
MRIFDDHIIHSASDLNAYLGCPRSIALTMAKRLDPAVLPDPVSDDEEMELLAQAGLDHEAAYLKQCRSNGNVSEIPERGSLDDRIAATIDAMREGIDVIFQATLRHDNWIGHIDFLERVDTPSDFGSWSYEPVDTKLAREPRAKHLIQLSLYAQMVEDAQGCAPKRLHVVLGDNSRRSFAAADFHHSVKAAQQRYLAFVDSLDRSPSLEAGEPCSACGLCGWRDYCAQGWEEADHLSRVAGMSRPQIKKLRDAGIDTLTALAEADPSRRIPKLADAMFAKLLRQAQLQLEEARNGTAIVEALPEAEDRGFLRFPKPDPADLFFDLEGDPHHPGGLEYLWGIHLRDEQGRAKFIHHWAHDREAERAAFEKVVDFFVAHLRDHPAAHVYHYAHYEITALRRLATAFASREQEVDDLLRAEKFVDLYAIARHAIRTSKRDMSLKSLEKFFAPAREEDVATAGASIVYYHRWKEAQGTAAGDAILENILDYNRVDCVNTEGLRDWLLNQRRDDLDWWVKEGRGEVDLAKVEERNELELRKERLRERLRTSERLAGGVGETLAHLVDFHHRAKKPALWAVFDRCDASENEWLDDLECIGGLQPFGGDWIRTEKRSYVARYSVSPKQDTKLRPGDGVLHAPSMETLGTIFDLDIENGWVEVKRGVAAGDFPEDGAIIAGWPIPDKVLAMGVLRNAEALAAGGGSAALMDLLRRNKPRFEVATEGALVRDEESLVDATTRNARNLDDSLLLIQGPPGTGKTFTSAHVIVSLIEDGKRIGITSNSHKAIDNLLQKVEDVAAERGVFFDGIKKASAQNEESRFDGENIGWTDQNKDIEEGSYALIGGTAFLFAREEMEGKLDYLFIDEAGQVSLGNMVAMAGSTRNLVLVGDQMQLPQPVQGAHPGESGLSALDYYLEGAATVASDRGILLDTSWRMHPDLCRFISDAVYEGRLKAHPDCANRRLHVEDWQDDALKPHGLSISAMDHEGCSQVSAEEAERIAGLIDELIGTHFTGRDGTVGEIGLQDILVVAPFNAQVNHLKARLPHGTRVGTVDKFQGQEAEVVIVSMTTSSPDDLPRHTDFFYSKNRLNVAVSRGRILSIFVMNPRLVDLNADSVEELQLLNTLAWAVGEGTR